MIALFFFSTSLGMFLINFYIKYVPIDDIIMLILASIFAEQIGKLLGGVLMKKFGFKVGAFISMAGAFISGVMYCLSNKMIVGLVISIFFTKIFASSNFNIMYFSVVQLMPTNVSGTAMSIC